MILTYSDKAECFYKHGFEEISADDILSIKIERLPKTWEDFCETSWLNIGDVIIYMCDSRIRVFDGDVYQLFSSCSYETSSIKRFL